MPIYDYACTRCGHVTEVIHGINDAGPRFCPACGAEGTMKKALSTPAIVFKGSGWAKVDRRSGGASTGTKPSRAKPSESSAPAAGEAGASRAISGAASGAGTTAGGPSSTSGGASSAASSSGAAKADD